MKPIDFDYINQLVIYLRKNLKKGYTKESLKWALINQGHSRLEIDKAFKKLEEELAKEAPILKTKPEIKYEFIEDKTFNPSEKEFKKKSFLKKFFG